MDNTVDPDSVECRASSAKQIICVRCQSIAELDLIFNLLFGDYGNTLLWKIQ